MRALGGCGAKRPGCGDTEGDRRTAGQDTHAQTWFAVRSHNAPRSFGKTKIISVLRAKNQRGERSGQAQPVHARHRTVLRPPGRRAWEGAGRSVPRAGGANVCRLLRRSHAKAFYGLFWLNLQHLPVWSFFAPVVNLCFEILKECNYFPKQPKQKLLPSSGMCEDTPY